ncbi:hypothetical protein V8F20_004622 [Naviculisporaceae sp. PSN 640]
MAPVGGISSQSDGAELREWMGRSRNTEVEIGCLLPPSHFTNRPCGAFYDEMRSLRIRRWVMWTTYSLEIRVHEEKHGISSMYGWTEPIWWRRKRQPVKEVRLEAGVGRGWEDEQVTVHKSVRIRLTIRTPTTATLRSYVSVYLSGHLGIWASGVEPPILPSCIRYYNKVIYCSSLFQSLSVLVRVRAFLLRATEKHYRRPASGYVNGGFLTVTRVAIDNIGALTMY